MNHENPGLRELPVAYQFSLGGKLETHPPSLGARKGIYLYYSGADPTGWEKDQGPPTQAEFHQARPSWAPRLISQDSIQQTKTSAPVEDQSTIAMTSDRTSVVAQMPNLELPKTSLAPSTILPNQDILDVLSRWQVVDSGVITTATTGQIDAFTIPDQFFALPQISRKLEGYQGIRGTFRVKILVNGNTAQQGIVMMRYIPLALVGGMLTNLRNANLITKTQVPTVRLYLNDTSEMEMEIPFISPNLFHDLMNGAGDWGVVYFDVESPLKTGATGSSSCSYTVLMCMDPSTVELLNPTYNVAPFPMSAYRADGIIMNKMKMTTRRKTEAQAAASGPLSSALSLVSAGAKAAGSLVPSLSAVTMPISWVAAVGSKTLSAFGYSKPMDDKAVQRTLGTTNPYFANCDGIQTATNAGIIMGNQVQCLPGFAGSSADEMSLSYLVSRETYHTQFNWADDTTQGTAMLEIPMRPTYFQTILVGPPVSTLAGPLGYLTNFFYYYHGSIKLTFRFAKTERHQGRMVVAFYPGTTITSDPGYANIAYAPQEVIDIATGSEWTFTFPYTSQKYYEQCGTQYGRVIVYVMNELSGDSTVANNIDCLVYVSAEPDFEFAFPRVNNGSIVSPGVDEGIIKNKAGKFQRKHVHVTVGNSSTTDQGVEYAAVCQGEKILSIKQLLMVPCQVPLLISTANQYYKMRPFTIGVTTDATAAGTGEWAGDTWSQFAPLYAMSRGGLILSVGEGTTQLDHCWWVQPNVNDDTASITGSNTAPGSLTAARRSISRDKYSSVYVPQYTQNQCRLNRVSTWRAATGTPEPVDQYSARSLLYLAGRNAAFSTMPDIYRAAADDTQLGFFLGVPPYSVGTQTTPMEQPPAPSSPPAFVPVDGEEATPPNLPSSAVSSPSSLTTATLWGRKTPATSQERKTTGPSAKAAGTVQTRSEHHDT